MVLLNRLIAIGLIAGAIPLWLQASGFPGSASIFPQVMIATIAVLALIMLARSFMPNAGRRDGEGRTDLRALGLPLVVFAVTVAGAVIMRNFGFFPAAVAMGIALFVLLPVQNRRLYVLLFTATLAFILVVFTFVLGVPLLSSRFF